MVFSNAFLLENGYLRSIVFDTVFSRRNFNVVFFSASLLLLWYVKKEPNKVNAAVAVNVV